MKGEQTVNDGADVLRSRLEFVTSLLLDLLTGADPEGRARAADALYAAENAGPVLDDLFARLHRACRRAKGEARDRIEAALGLVLALSVRDCAAQAFAKDRAGQPYAAGGGWAAGPSLPADGSADSAGKGTPCSARQLTAGPRPGRRGRRGGGGAV